MAGHIHIQETGIWNVTAGQWTLLHEHESLQEVSEESEGSNKSDDPDESNEEITI